MRKQWSADVTLTDMVQTLLSDQFPDLNCAEVQLLDEGWDNSVFLVNGSFVVRFPQRRVAVELIEIENHAPPWLSSRLPLSIPNPTFIGKPTTEYPFPFSGYLKITGHILHRLNLNDNTCYSSRN